MLLLGAAASSGLESAQYARSDSLANHMGLFLQKTNIIRDYLVRHAHTHTHIHTVRTVVMELCFKLLGFMFAKKRKPGCQTGRLLQLAPVW